MDLDMALRSVSSTIRKSEKAYATLSQKETPNPGQLRRVAGDLKNHFAMRALLEQARSGEGPGLEPGERDALRAALPGYIARIGKVLPKFREGTPQHTLAWRRIEAYRMVLGLLEEAPSYRD